jgi:hypothetical protein
MGLEPTDDLVSSGADVITRPTPSGERVSNR